MMIPVFHVWVRIGRLYYQLKQRTQEVRRNFWVIGEVVEDNRIDLTSEFADI